MLSTVDINLLLASAALAIVTGPVMHHHPHIHRASGKLIRIASNMHNFSKRGLPSRHVSSLMVQQTKLMMDSSIPSVKPKEWIWSNVPIACRFHLLDNYLPGSNKTPQRQPAKMLIVFQSNQSTNIKNYLFKLQRSLWNLAQLQEKMLINNTLHITSKKLINQTRFSQPTRSVVPHDFISPEALFCLRDFNIILGLLIVEQGFIVHLYFPCK